MSYHLISVSHAMWALGDHKVAVRSVSKPLESAKFDGKGEEQLLWAGRAAVLGEVKIAKSLVSSKIALADDNQKWRIPATKAIIQCADGQAEKCAKSLLSLKNSAPPLGLSDAKVTAARLIVKSNPEIAKQLVEGLESNPAASVLRELGDAEAAKQAAESGVYSNFLNQGG